MTTNEDEFKFPDEAQTAADKSTGIETELNMDDVEIEIVNDVPEQDRDRPALESPVEDPTDDELKEYSSKVQDRIKKLTHARHDERRRADTLQRERDELERLARDAISARDFLQKQAKLGSKALSEQQATLADRDVVEAKAALKAAHDAFDTDAIVDAQEKLNDAQLRKATAANIRQRAVQDDENGVESTATSQPVVPALDDKTASWMSKNKWFGKGGDEAMTGFALGLHEQLVKKHGEGYTRTDEYYSHIDATVRKTFPDKFQQKAEPSRQKSVVASASRTPAARKVTLTATQVALAKKFGLTPQQYAAETLKLEQ
jgi:hypothetical protein